MSDIDSAEAPSKPSQLHTLLAKYPLQENPYVRMHSQKDTRRRIFGTKEKIFSSVEAETDNLKLAASLFREYLNRGTIDKAAFGERVGKNMVRFLDRLALSNHPTPEQLTAINKAHSYYHSILGQEYDQRISGFLAEYAVMRSLSDSLKRDYSLKHKDHPEDMPRIEYPSEDEDIHYKVDFWVNMNGEGGKRTGVQIKCLQLDEDPDQKIFTISSTRDLAVLAGKIGYKLPQADKDKFISNGQQMLQVLDADRNINTACIILPNPKYKFEVFNTISGLPTEHLRSQLGQEMKKNLNP